MNDKIFKCENQDCLAEYCRQCGDPPHIPLRCEEVERPKDLAARLRIEEEMSAALFRICHKCGKKIVKKGGCIHMTCSCGAEMCYVCRRPYSQCNRARCARFSDEKQLHNMEVEEAGNRARTRELNENPDLHLVHDPTKQ